MFSPSLICKGFQLLVFFYDFNLNFFHYFCFMFFVVICKFTLLNNLTLELLYCLCSVSWTPSFLLKRYVLTGIRNGPHEPFIADSLDFVVSQVKSQMFNYFYDGLKQSPLCILKFQKKKSPLCI